MLRRAFLKYFGLDHQQEQHVRVANNVGALVFLQIIHYALPLAILPVLILRLGPENYGTLAFGLYTIQYLVTLTDYGFLFSATRQVSLHQMQTPALSEIFWSVQLCRMLISMLGFVLLLVFMANVGLSESERAVLMLLFFTVIGNVLSPQWIFQGMERMRWITLVQLVSKLSLLISVFLLVKSPADLSRAAFLHGITQLAAGLLSLIIAIRLFRIKWVVPQVSSVWKQLRDGWHVFITTFYTTLYVNTNGFLLKFITGSNEVVGYYQAGEKIVRAVASLFNPFMTALFPYVSRQMAENKKEGVAMFFRILNRLSVITFICMVGLWLTAPLIADVLMGDASEKTIPVIQILAVIVFFGTAGAMLSLQLFLNIGWKRRLPYFLFGLALLDLVLCFWLIPHSSQNGAALALAITEVAAPALYLFYYRNYGTRILNN